MLWCAQWYARERGWRVVPIRAGSKVPDLVDWPRQATTDPSVIEDWWTNGHAGSGIGIATGPESGIFVLDVDDNGVDKLGKDTLAALIEPHDGLPDTVTAVTPGGGLHYYWRWPGFALRESLGPNLDIRGAGRQVLAPPSVHPNGGTYLWEESGRPSVVDVSDAPAWVLEDLRLPTAPGSGTDLDERYERILRAADWRLDRVDGGGLAHWVRPGKDRRLGSSATVYPDHCTIWSTSVSGVETHRPYLPRELAEALGVTSALAEPQSGSEASAAVSHVTLTAAASVTARRTIWLWERRVPLGGAVLLAGQEGLGKSTLAVNLAAEVTTGTVQGDLSGPASVVYVSAEDSESSTIVPRLTAAGADLSRVYFVRIDGIPGGLLVPRDLGELTAIMRQVGAVLLVLDPLTVHVGDDRTDSHNERDVRRALAPLALSMEALGASAVGIMHWNKAPTTTALDRVLGSRAFTAAARAVLGVGEDPTDPAKRLLVPVKSNLGPPAAALAFRIEQRYIDDPAGGMPIETSALIWEGERAGIRSTDLFKVADVDDDGASIGRARRVPPGRAGRPRRSHHVEGSRRLVPRRGHLSSHDAACTSSRRGPRCAPARRRRAPHLGLGSAACRHHSSRPPSSIR